MRASREGWTADSSAVYSDVNGVYIYPPVQAIDDAPSHHHSVFVAPYGKHNWLQIEFNGAVAGAISQVEVHKRAFVTSRFYVRVDRVLFSQTWLTVKAGRLASPVTLLTGGWL